MKIYIGADHRGYKLKEKIAIWLFELGYTFFDLGALTLNPNDDFTKYAEEVASLVARNDDSKGILLCGSGVGVNVVANKFDGIRAGIGKTASQVMAARKDDDMNVLVIASDFTKDQEARDMLATFLETKFSGKKRHLRRLNEIGKLEENN